MSGFFFDEDRLWGNPVSYTHLDVYKRQVVTTASGKLNVRSSSSSSAAVAASLNKGSYVTLISKSGDWWKVEYAKGKYGYCHAGFITVTEGTPVSVAVSSGTLNVRSGAGTAYEMCIRDRFNAVNNKKFYHEYECNMRSRLGVIGTKGLKDEKTFCLDDDIETMCGEIISEIENEVIPVFDILSSRQDILEHRREYPWLDRLNNHLIKLEESLIYGPVSYTHLPVCVFSPFRIAPFRLYVGLLYFIKVRLSIDSFLGRMTFLLSAESGQKTPESQEFRRFRRFRCV